MLHIACCCDEAIPRLAVLCNSPRLMMCHRLPFCGWALCAVGGDSSFAILQFGARSAFQRGQEIALPRRRLRISGADGSACCSRGLA